MLCTWENKISDVFRVSQSWRVRARAQMTTFRCVVDQIATCCHADVHICQPVLCIKYWGHRRILHFHGFHENTGFSCQTWESWIFRDSRKMYFSLGFWLDVCGVDVKTSRYLTFCRCARGFHVITVPHGARMRWLKLAVAWANILRPGGRDSPPSPTHKTMTTLKIQDFPCSQHFVAYQGMSYVNSCMAKGCKSIRSAPECCHLNSASHASGLEHTEHIWEVVFPVAEYGEITQLLRNCQKVRKPWKPGFHGFSWFFTVFHGFWWFFMVFHGFSWFQVGFSWFFMVPGWFFMVPGWFSS